MVKVVKYEDKYKIAWDEFINESKNGVFFFRRDYMDYNSERFIDFSLMFFDENKLVAIMPANIREQVVYSHEGLTFGGMVYNNKMKTNTMLEIFDALNEFLKDNGVEKLVYKAIPHIYHTIPAEEDLYALYCNNASLIRREVASIIVLDERLKQSKRRRQSINKSPENNLKVAKSDDFKKFMTLEEPDLEEKHGLKSTYTPEEMQLLASRFQDNINLFTVEKDGEMLAGMMMYEDDNIAHGQYLASSSEGKKLKAAEFLFEFLIQYYCNSHKKYLDFGISTEINGLYPNDSLIFLKESFGARATVYDFYVMDSDLTFGLVL